MKPEAYHKKSKQLKELEASIQNDEKEVKSLEKNIEKKEIRIQKIENELEEVNDLVYCKKCNKVYRIDNLPQQEYIDRKSRYYGHNDVSVDYVPWTVYKCKRCKTFLAKGDSSSLATQDELEKLYDLQHATHLDLMLRNIEDEEPRIHELKKIKWWQRKKEKRRKK
jgi:hypothetical protein